MMKTALATLLTLTLTTVALAQPPGIKRVYPISVRDNSVVKDRLSGYYPAENAFDGNPATSWRMNWGKKCCSTLIVEIPSDIPISAVGLDFYEGKTRSYKVQIYVVSGSEIATVHYSASSQRQGMHLYPLDQEITGEFLIISIYDNGLQDENIPGPLPARAKWASINEVRLYAKAILLPWPLDER